VSKIGDHATLRSVVGLIYQVRLHVSTFFSYPKAPHIRATGYKLIGALSILGPKTERFNEEVIMKMEDKQTCLPEYPTQHRWSSLTRQRGSGHVV
jgi:hypothetical protein